MKEKVFNIVLIGAGGQGVLTLLKILAEAALKQGIDLRTSEVHGLSQRGGIITCTLRFGKKVYSSMVRKGSANLVISLEEMEAVRACIYASKQAGTNFLVNTYRIYQPMMYLRNEKYPDRKQILNYLKKFGKRAVFVDATLEVKKAVGNARTANTYLLGRLKREGFLPLSRECLLAAIKEFFSEKYFEMNKKAFDLGMKK
jgi:indolepyruvate ferredoxin oxidoreductase beta subunit